MKTQLKTPYQDTSPNEPMKLYEGQLQLTSGDESVSGVGTITFKWLPSLRVIAEFQLPAEAKQEDHRFMFRLSATDADLILYVPGSKNGGCFSVTSSSFGMSQNSILRGRVSPSLDVGNGTSLASAILHAVNMREYYDLSSSDPASRITPTIILKSLRWTISFTAVSNLDNLEKVLNDTGGFGITHVLNASRLENEFFGAEELNDLSDALCNYLTFVSGRVVHAILPIGLSEGGDQIWRNWSPWNVDGWKSVLSWVDVHHGDAIGKAFPGFMMKWEEPGWRDLIRLVVALYAHANRNETGLENGIVLAAMALDAAAWQLLVLQDSVVSKNKFKSLTAQQRIKFMCSRLNIPLDIHPKLKELTANAAALNWVDSADAVVTIRNNIVHPDAKLRSQLLTDRAFFEAWLTSLWILEMTMLRLFDYDGGYSDRRSIPSFVGTLTQVLWSSPNPV